MAHGDGGRGRGRCDDGWMTTGSRQPKRMTNTTHHMTTKRHRDDTHFKTRGDEQPREHHAAREQHVPSSWLYRTPCTCTHTHPHTTYAAQHEAIHACQGFARVMDLSPGTHGDQQRPEATPSPSESPSIATTRACSTHAQRAASRAKTHIHCQQPSRTSASCASCPQAALCRPQAALRRPLVGTQAGRRTSASRSQVSGGREAPKRSHVCAPSEPNDTHTTASCNP